MANAKLFAAHIPTPKWNLKMLTKVWKHNRVISLKIFLSIQTITEYEVNKHITSEDQKKEIHTLNDECGKKSIHHQGIQVFNPNLDN